jgi:ParB-like chromosome segregation protein Spo0J
MTKINDYAIDIWHCDDPRLPKNEDIMREPPESSFVNDIIENGQLQPILMCHNEQDGWFLAFGRRRLLAIRQAFAIKNDKGQPMHDGNVFVRIGEGIQRNDGYIFALVENAQRNSNPISDYLAIRELLLMPGSKTFKEIATLMHVSVSYVKEADRKLCKVPTWALEGALNDTIKLSTAIGIGKFSTTKQKEVKKLYTEKGKITGGDVKEIHRAIKNDMVAQISTLTGMTTSIDDNFRQYFNRDELLAIQVLLNEGKTVQAKKSLASLLDEKTV